MSHRSIAHLSDLHIGCTPQHSLVAVKICDQINNLNIDEVIVTGDITEHGQSSEYAEFKKIFSILKAKLTIVPGNHDCLRDAVAKEMMESPHADLIQSPDLSIIRINSTGWHNRFVFASHGRIDKWILSEVDRLLKLIPSNHFVVTALHHHPLPLPLEYLSERLSTWLYLPFADELAWGSVLLERLRGRCDLVLHGHRHIPSEMAISDSKKILRIYNAGSSTLLGKFRHFIYRDGRLLGKPRWIKI